MIIRSGRWTSLSLKLSVYSDGKSMQQLFVFLTLNM